MNRLMVFRGLNAAYCANNLKYKDFVAERQSDYNVKPSGT